MTVRPTESQRLLLGAAVLHGRDARAAWVQWRRAGGEIDTVTPSSFRLLPLLYRNLEANRIDDPDLPRLKGVYRHAWVVNQRLARRFELAIEALARAGIPTMTLGGLAVSAVHYRDGGVRRMDDAGVLVPPAQVGPALTVLRAGGFSPLGHVDPGAVLRGGRALALVEPGGARIELRCRAFPESAGDEDFWSGAVAATVGAAATLAPGPTEQLLHACAYGVRSGPHALLWIADAAVILRTAEREIDWARLVDGAARRGLAFTTGSALAILGDLVGETIPEHAVGELRAQPGRVRERLLLALSGRPGSVLRRVHLWDVHRRRDPPRRTGPSPVIGSAGDPIGRERDGAIASPSRARPHLSQRVSGEVQSRDLTRDA